MTKKNKSMESKVAMRIWRAIQNDWSFRFPKKSPVPHSRHSIWVSKPDSDLWYAEKVDGTEEDWINALLDEAGVPK